VITGPEEGPAAGRGHLRAAHADREHVIGLLKAAFVQDRLTKDELEARTGQALTARTYAELGALTADIPADIPAPQLSPPGLARRHGGAVHYRVRGGHFSGAEALPQAATAATGPGWPGTRSAPARQHCP
jgi:hypothetical protein